MDIIKSKEIMSEYDSKVFSMYFGDMSFAAFDIETTGLSPSSGAVILTGFCSCQNGSCDVVQFFAESIREEDQLLEASFEYMKNFDFFITYNGRRFDTPFMMKRASRNGIRSFRHYFDLDLYPIVKRFSDIGCFTPNLRQKTLENFMGLESSRNDTIDGARSVRMYYDYLLERDEDLKEKILLHNHDDVLQLYKLLPVLARTDVHKAMNRLGFPVKTSRGIFIVNEIRLGSRRLLIKGLQENYPIIYTDPGDGCLSCELRQDGSFEINAAITSSNGLIIADTGKLCVDTDCFVDLPTYGSGYLVLADNRPKADSVSGKGTENTKNYMEINLLAKKITERVINYEL